MDSKLIPFEFENKPVRTFKDKNGEPWFVAKDVCAALNLLNYRQVMDRIEDDEKGVHFMDTLGGRQEMLCVNEFGLYSLALKSRKAEARRFQRWITHEVIPAILKTGRYEMPAPPAPKSESVVLFQVLDQISQTCKAMLLQIENVDGRMTSLEVRFDGQAVQTKESDHLLELIRAWGGRFNSKHGYAKAHQKFNEHFGVSKYSHLPQNRYNEAVTWLQGRLDSTRPLTNPFPM